MSQRVTPEFLRSELKQLDTWSRQTLDRPLSWILVKRFVEERLDQIQAGEIANRFAKIMPADLAEIRKQAILIEEEMGARPKNRPKAVREQALKDPSGAQSGQGKRGKSLA